MRKPKPPRPVGREQRAIQAAPKSVRLFGGNSAGERKASSETTVAEQFFRAPATDWPRNDLQRRMQSSGG